MRNMILSCISCSIVFCILSNSAFVESKSKPRTADKELSDLPHTFEGEHSLAFDHDAFLGRDEAKRFDDLTPEESKQKLGEIVDKIDLDSDGQITTEEMAAWISRGMLLDDVDRAWKDLELSEGDKLSWEKHMDELFGEDGDLEDEDDETKKTISARDKRRWATADVDGDGKLSKEEYLAFLHPKQDPKMRQVVIKETMEDVDKNNDGFIDLDEYIKDLWSSNFPNEVEPEWVKTERNKFSEQRDVNRDGKLDLDEVDKWIATDDNNVQAEVTHLLSESDADQDGKLSKSEILNRYDLFVGSQATNFGEILTGHDEL
ncbi:hypothetical protein MN116_003423 [Schistosoma mekongi]|uniref:Reticulocalbin-3 n=1 Tax=Schistosoma mekongi TaxID=38744 RepID=A0AAE1ZI68_SCHME|nr:hypothetical protein MN116_003423 [Schistosoma mekongi]